MRKAIYLTFLAERAKDALVPVFPNAPKFRLPEDGNTPIIMIGPSTVVAPFRDSLQERKTTKTKGKNRLFFGSQHKHCNYYYEDEFEKLQSNGLLTHLDLAWSRDMAAKSYVQHKMSENADETWKWMDVKGRISSFAAMRAAWLRAWTPHSVKSFRTKAASRKKKISTSEKLEADKRDVYWEDKLVAIEPLSLYLFGLRSCFVISHLSLLNSHAGSCRSTKTCCSCVAMDSAKSISWETRRQSSLEQRFLGKGHAPF